MRSGVALWRTLLVTGVALVVVVVSGGDQVLGEGGTWTLKAPMPTPRVGLAVGIVNGILYAVGGATQAGSDYLSTAEAYDPARNMWTVKAPMPTPREGLAVGVVNGILREFGLTPMDSLPAVATARQASGVNQEWKRRYLSPTARAKRQLKAAVKQILRRA